MRFVIRGFCRNWVMSDGFVVLWFCHRWFIVGGSFVAGVFCHVSGPSGRVAVSAMLLSSDNNDADE